MNPVVTVTAIAARPWSSALRRHRKVCSLSNAKAERLVNLADFAPLAQISRVAEVQWALV